MLEMSKGSLCDNSFLICHLMLFHLKSETLLLADKRRRKKRRGRTGPGLTPGNVGEEGEKEVKRKMILQAARKLKLKSSKRVYENDSEDEFYDVERSNPVQDEVTCVSSVSAAVDATSQASACPWKEELEVLVRGGAPMALRETPVENYYQNLLATDGLGKDTELQERMEPADEKGLCTDPLAAVEKWKGQIEKKRSEAIANCLC
ncbi:hypothetical protein Bca52824_029073 [Brassica carinata]|uniref:Uncharacterized protein n=1 Tax=Brassica carinata TaxID=52824 RepID=A0A8X8AP66_BRACI|nr:hypothetical protein Bca52824_029073 [Brassica carinata]